MKTLDPAKISVRLKADGFYVAYEGEGEQLCPPGMQEQLNNTYCRDIFLNNKVLMLKACICEALNIKLK